MKNENIKKFKSVMLDSLLWIVIVGGIVMFIMAFGIGANDVANTLGTSIGSKVLTYRQAVVVAGVFEFTGAALMGSHVTDTIRKKIIDIAVYNSEPELLMVVMLAALFGAAIWLIAASLMRLPVSTTHTMIGAVIGASLAAKGAEGVDGPAVGFVVLSWVVSPAASGIISLLLFLFIRHFILRSDNALKRGYIMLPVFYGLTLFINAFFIIYKGSPALGLEDTPIGIGIGISLGIGAFVALIMIYPGIPLARKYIRWKDQKIITEYMNENPNIRLEIDLETDEHRMIDIETDKVFNIDHQTSIDMMNKIYRDNISKDGKFSKCIHFWISQKRCLKRSTSDSDTDENEEIDGFDTVDESDIEQTKCTKCGITIKEKWKQFHDFLDHIQGKDRSEEVHAAAELFDFKVETLFSLLQVLTACFDSFAHGANDVANAIAPFAAIYTIYQTGVVSSTAPVEWWILVLGGAGIVVGLTMWGYKVIRTIGQKLTKITASRGFTIELGSAVTVVTASRLGFPVSTTHSQVGSVVAVGLSEGIKQVNGRLLIGILLSWLFTLPFSGGIAALFVVILRTAI